MPLTMTKAGDTVTIRKITGKDEVRQHLAELGFVVGETVTVVKIHGEGAVRRRIMDMGLTKGVSVTVRKVAPLGDPIQLNVRGYELSIRKADADMVEVQ